MTARLAAVPADRMQLALMLALTFATGVVDAVGYLGLDRVFTGNMTGNVVILGMAVVGADDLPVLGPLLALAGFMAGAAVAGRVLRAETHAWSPRTTALFGGVAVAVLGLAGVLLAAGDPERPVQVLSTCVLGAAMGTQAAAARAVGVRDVTTVVVTSTITGLAADSVLGSGKRGGSGRRVAAVVLIVAGAAAGAVLLRWSLGAGVLLAGVVIAVVTVLGAWHARASAG